MAGWAVSASAHGSPESPHVIVLIRVLSLLSKRVGLRTSTPPPGRFPLMCSVFFTVYPCFTDRSRHSCVRDVEPHPAPRPFLPVFPEPLAMTSTLSLPALLTTGIALRPLHAAFGMEVLGLDLSAPLPAPVLEV